MPYTVPRTMEEGLLHDAMRENFSPEGVATIIAFLQPAAMKRTDNQEAASALQQVEWFTEVLTNLLGGPKKVSEFFEELGL